MNLANRFQYISITLALNMMLLTNIAKALDTFDTLATYSQLSSLSIRQSSHSEVQVKKMFCL